MKKGEPESLGTYRCPVCGHGDTAELDTESAGRRFDCSYCGAALEVGEQDPGSVRLNVRLVDADDDGSGRKES